VYTSRLENAVISCVEGDGAMRFMMQVITNENQGTPPQALMDAMGEFIEKEMNTGRLIDTGGLAPTSMGTRVRLSKGHISAVDGPFSESKEIVGGYAIMEFNSKEEAIEVAKEFMELHATHWPEWNGESEIRQIFGPND
jgi:hypothetical protein